MSADWWWSNYRDRIIGWIAFGPRHEECMAIERQLCIDEANARAENLNKGSDDLDFDLWELRRRADSKLERLFDERWKPPFQVEFSGHGPSRHCKRVSE